MGSPAPSATTARRRLLVSSETASHRLSTPNKYNRQLYRLYSRSSFTTMDHFLWFLFPAATSSLPRLRKLHSDQKTLLQKFGLQKEIFNSSRLCRLMIDMTRWAKVSMRNLVGSGLVMIVLVLMGRTTTTTNNRVVPSYSERCSRCRNCGHPGKKHLATLCECGEYYYECQIKGCDCAWANCDHVFGKRKVRG